MKLVWSERSARDCYHFYKNDQASFHRVHDLIEDIKNRPYKGIGDPVKLRAPLEGYWSRRIDRVNRLVYKIKGDQLVIAQCKFHG